ncbi:hypothetical protein EDC04DRAFT_2661857 [Pisolithus marmoratus]|nr:hypothetical protein EDC04DRAFT_2661857 [Pisolithus marmoratus]
MCLTRFSADTRLFVVHRRVALQPSSKASYVALDEDAGPSKLAAINKHRLWTLSEDHFLELIRRVGPSGMECGTGAKGAGLDEKFRKKMEQEGEAIRSATREVGKGRLKR